jgi:hypothetical protein
MAKNNVKTSPHKTPFWSAQFKSFIWKITLCFIVISKTLTF